MTHRAVTLDDACSAHLLDRKWLLAPSLRVGHQWIEALVRNGRSVVNLHPMTVLHMALNIVGADLAANRLMFINRFVGALVVQASWRDLSREGYLGRLEQSAELSNIVFESILSLRLAGCSAVQIEASKLESHEKAADIRQLSNAYESFLSNHGLVDEADVLSRAVEKLDASPQSLDEDVLVLIPSSIQVAGLEQAFLDALPGAKRIEIKHPADPSVYGGSTLDIQLLANIGKTGTQLPPTNDGSVRLFRAVGEINEVREVLRRCLADQQPLDDVEILHTDAETYVPLIYATARRYFSEPDRPDGVPVTFAEGIPASLSRPGRAFVAWLEWIHADYPQRRLVEMIADGLLACGDEEELSFGYLARLLRSMAIGWGGDRYLPKLDEQIKAVRELPLKTTDGGEDEALATGVHQRKRKGLESLRKMVKQLLSLSQEFASSTRDKALDLAERFLETTARSVSELDRYATQALIDQLRERRFWLERLGEAIDVGEWLTALPSQTRVLGSSPRPGRVHVVHVRSGGQSGRKRTFVIGLDDRRFPGAALQDPVLLDRERIRLNSALATSAARLRERIDGFALMLSRLSGSVTLSWPCYDLVDDRDTFPSSVVLSAYRLISGRHDADLDALHEAVGPPASFAPTTAEKALDESERWLWRLADGASHGMNHLPLVESHFPHLARGSEAERQRFTTFGPFSGYVPQAGKDLNPFAADAHALSASALETAGRCPLAFFFRNGLAVYSPEELEMDPDRWLNAAQFGLLLHDVFRRFLSELSSVDQRPEFQRDHARLAQILREEIDRWRRNVPPPNENAFRMQSWQLIRTARIFLLDEEEFCRNSQPRYFEVALGLESIAGEGPLDESEPIKVRLANRKSIRARGQIDRVDQIGERQFAVWDYKIASGYGYDREDPFRQGRRIQNILYLRIIETALRKKLDPQAVVEQFGYFFPSVRAHGLRVHWNADKLAAGLGVLERLCDSISGGVFPATDHVDDCRYCDYASICADVNRVTAHSKSLLEQDDLVPLRYFRELRSG